MMLLTACEKSDLDQVKSLISYENLEARNPQGYTALSIASKQGSIDIIKTLIASGAKINTINDAKQTPLFIACWSNQEDSVKQLLSLGADPNIADKRGWTPLIISVYQNNEKIVETLISHGCELEKKDCFGKQAIDRAKTLKMVDLLKFAISKGRKLKNPPKSARVSPTCTPRSAQPLSSLKSQSFDNRNITPVSQRSHHSSSFSSPRELSVDFRKSMKDKIDKRINERFLSNQGFLTTSWQGLSKGFIEKEVTYQSCKLKDWISESIEAKNREMSDKVIEESRKIVENLMKSLKNVENENKKEEDNKEIKLIEQFHDNFSSSQYKATNLVERKVEALVEGEIRKTKDMINADILKMIDREIDGVFMKNDAVINRVLQRFIQTEDSDEFRSPEKKLTHVSRSLNSSSVPQFDVNSTLQDFIKVSGRKK